MTPRVHQHGACGSGIAAHGDGAVVLAKAGPAHVALLLCYFDFFLVHRVLLCDFLIIVFCILHPDIGHSGLASRAKIR